MSRKRLQEINKWNRPAFMPKENLFFDGGAVLPSLPQTPDYSKIRLKAPSTDLGGIGGALSGLQDKLGGVMGGGKLAGSPIGGMVGALGSAVGGLANNLISNGLNSGAGSAVSSIGGTVGSMVSNVNPVLGGIISVGSGIIGGGINALFGESVDEEALQKANEGTASYNNFVSNAGSFDDIKGPETVANVKDDIYKGGLLNDVSYKNEELKQQRADAKSWAFRGIDNNIHNLVSDQINNALANYSAFGGPIDTSDMGAINYDFMDRYLTSKENQAQNKNISNSPNVLNAAKTFGFGGFVPNPFEPYGGFTSKDEFDHWQTEQAKKEEPYAGVTGNIPSDANGSSFTWALGGDMQTNSTDWSTGLMHINAGGSHESSPYDGVQIGTDSEGTPNLVEEGETIWNDYVFSTRILADEETKKKFHLPKKKDITYADISKKLEKEIAERPNDPISEAGFNAQMEQLANEQERQKAEMEAERAREAFEALSPEEQTAIMQRAAQEEAMAQQAAQEQAMAEQQAEGLYSPEEIAMMQQQQMQADGSQANLGMEPQIQACGGKINKYDDGGKLREKMMKLANNSKTWDDFWKWAKDNKVEDVLRPLFAEDTKELNWKDALADETFKKAIAKGNPALIDAISRGYDFGMYKPLTENTSFDDDRGNWDAQTVQGWWGSDDPAWKEVIKNHPEITKETNLTKKQLEEYLSSTDAFKKGTAWLQASPENRATYLRRILNNPNAPKRAREYALKFMDEAGNWREGVDNGYDAIFNNPSGRAANPGTYWKTPIEAVRGNNAQNLLINENGTVSEITGDLEGLEALDSYNWQDENNDNAINYYKKKGVAITPEEKAKAAEIAAATEEPAEEEPQRGVRPVHRNEDLRYAGLFGPAVGLGMMAAGIGKPDYSSLNAAVANTGTPHLASAKYLGDYEKYTPLDIWYEQNALNAQARAADRTIMNSSLPTTSKYAALLANNYNTQLASGNLFRQAQEYNDAKYHRTKEFNRGTNQYNADTFNRLSQFNADVLNRAGQYKSGMAMQAAAQKLNADANWYNSLYGNVSGIFKGLSDLGRENAQRNQVADMAAAGIFGVMNPDRFNPNGILRWETDDEMQKRLNKQKKITAKGGKIKRKKGLTF